MPIPDGVWLGDSAALGVVFSSTVVEDPEFVNC